MTTCAWLFPGSVAQRQNLKQYLEQQYRNGILVYGIHVSDRALMTCVISDYSLNHVHFVDGSDGGYAMAATALKRATETPFYKHKKIKFMRIAMPVLLLLLAIAAIVYKYSGDIVVGFTKDQVVPYVLTTDDVKAGCAMINAFCTCNIKFSPE